MALDHVLTPLGRCAGAGQLVVDREGQGPGEEVGEDRGGDPVLLDRHRGRVRRQQPAQVVDHRARLQLQGLGDRCGGGHRLRREEDGAWLHPPALHLLTKGGQAQLQVHLGRGDEGALALVALQDAVGHEGVNGLPYGHAGDREGLAQFALGGDRVSGAQAVGDEGEKVVAHDDVLGSRLCGAGGREGQHR